MSLLFLLCYLLALAATARDAPAAQSFHRRDFSTIRGANYIPSYAKTSVQYWKDFRPQVIDREMGYAEALNLNSVRVWLQYWNYQHNPRQFLDHVNDFLQIAAKHHIRPMLVIFDSCFGISPSAESAEMWVASPGPDHMGKDFYPDGDRYVRALMERFGKDPRVLMWDVMNEPESTWLAFTPQGKKVIYAFVRHYIRYIHSLGPIQPVTMGANGTHNDEVMKYVDVLSLHGYETSADRLRKDIAKTRNDAAKVGKPFIISECAAPGWGMDYNWTMRVLRKERIGFYVWQLMVGSDQFRTVGGLVYPDGTVRDPKAASAVSGKSRRAFIRKPDSEGIPIRHRAPGHIDWQHLYSLALQRFRRTPTNAENFSERSTYFRSYIFVKRIGSPIWLEAYQGRIDHDLRLVHKAMTFGKKQQAFRLLDSLIKGIPAPDQ